MCTYPLSNRMPRWLCLSALRARAKSATTCALNRKGLKNNPPILLACKPMAIASTNCKEIQMPHIENFKSFMATGLVCPPHMAKKEYRVGAEAPIHPPALVEPMCLTGKYLYVL